MKWKQLRPRVDALARLRRTPAHEILGVPADASAEAVKAAYRRKARAYHPDRVDPFLKPHCEEMMKMLNRAYDVMLARGGR